MAPRNPEDWVDSFDDGLVEKKTPLQDWFTQEGRSCVYEYDFGDSWEHSITLEKIMPADPAVAYPRCIAGKRACPPEDAGGIPGYMEKLEILKHPRDEYYRDVKEWMGEFDPEHFSIEEVAFADVDRHDLEKRES